MMLDKFRRFARTLIQPFLWRLYRRYQADSRWYQYEGLKIRVHPSVFHPGLFFSTKLLFQFMLSRSPQDKQTLELGAGSGMIALGAAREGAQVTATDINPAAINAIQESSQANQLDLQLIQSDLFDAIPSTRFDLIFINPPYYPKDPGSDSEKAFFCGQNFEYFKRLFQQLPNYVHPATEVYMILTDDCELSTITGLAKERGLEMKVIQQTKKWGELNLIYKIQS